MPGGQIFLQKKKKKDNNKRRRLIRDRRVCIVSKGLAFLSSMIQESKFYEN